MLFDSAYRKNGNHYPKVFVLDKFIRKFFGKV